MIALTRREAATAREALVQRLGILTTHFVNLRGKDPSIDLSDLKQQIIDAQALADNLRDAIDRADRADRLDREWLARKAIIDAAQTADEPELRAMWGDR